MVRDGRQNVDFQRQTDWGGSATSVRDLGPQLCIHEMGK